MRVLLFFGLIYSSACTDKLEKKEQIEKQQDNLSNEDSSSNEDSAEEIEQIEIDMIAVLELFSERCGACHGSWPPDLGENPCETVINQPSSQVSSMYYVTPFDIENSYLWHKTNGTAGEFGDYPSQMPASSDALSVEEVDLIQRWIETGAICD